MKTKTWIHFSLILIICFTPSTVLGKTKDKKSGSADMNIPVGTSFKTSKLENEKEAIASDYPVDAFTYVLGPGDRIGIGVMGEIYQDFELDVNPQGGIVIPEIGFFSCVNTTIDSFQIYLQKALTAKLKFDSIKVFLTEAKSIRFTITGAVRTPGIFVLKSPARLSDALETAKLAPWGRMDSIVITNNTDEKWVNLFSFYKTGDPSLNPVLPAGATIMIPSGIENGRCIYLKTKAVSTPLAIPSEAHLSDLPLLLPEGFENVNQTKITVIRDGSSQILDTYSSFLLKDGDTITVASLTPKVFVAGMVNNPGEIEYSPSFTVEQYIALAGGANLNGNLNGSKVFRNGKKVGLSLNDYPLPGDIIQVPVRWLSRVGEYLGFVSGIASLVMMGKLAGAY
jgi:protein involved in polysaccharide export with SLBB domain